MDTAEITEFLATQETGVLSLAKDDDGYGVPVSFALDPDEGAEGGAGDDRGGGREPALYFRFGFAPGSTKREYVEASDDVSFVVYDDTAEGWKSVVARGRLENVSARSIDAIVAEAVQGLDIPYFAVHGDSVERLHFTLVRLHVTSLTGIVEGRADS
jgi:hypothetical protein